MLANAGTTNLMRFINKASYFNKQLKSKHCFYVKADIGNVTVMVDKVQYVNNVKLILESGPYTTLKTPLTTDKLVIDKSRGRSLSSNCRH